MADAPEKRKLQLFPWSGGMARDGSSAIKPASSLHLAENIVYDLAGGRMRRGGQVHLHRFPIREGTAFEDHFLDADLDDGRWGVQTVHANHTLSSRRRSVVQVIQRASTGGTTTISNRVGTQGLDIPENRMKHLVQTLSDDPRDAENQTTEISVEFRLKLNDLGSDGKLEFDIRPGRVDDSLIAEWHLQLRFSTSLFIRNASGVMTQLTTDFGSPGLFVQDTDWHTWRFDLKRTGSTSYTTDVFFEGVTLATGVEIDNDSIAGTTFVELTFDSGTSSTYDVELDRIDVQAEVQEIRGMFEFSEDPTDIMGATRKRAIYAGTRVYLDIGNPYYLPCIDDELPRDQFCSFEVFDSNIRPLRVDQLDNRTSAI